MPIQEDWNTTEKTAVELVERKFSPKMLRTADEVVAFTAKIEKTDGCWVWKGATMPAGYGQHSVKNRKFLAHRAAFEVANGNIPKGYVVCHRCDNPRCVRPSHLFVGTQRENLKDMDAKGRRPVGENHPDAKITTATVAWIRETYARGGITQQKIADAVGVTQSLVCRICAGTQRSSG